MSSPAPPPEPDPQGRPSFDKPADTPPPPPAGGGYGQAPPPPQQGYGQPAQQGYGQPPAGYGAPGAPVSQSDERLWSMLGHLGGIILQFIAPLIVYLVYKDRSQFIRRQSAEALNFQIVIVIALVIAWASTALLIGFLLVPLIYIANLVFCIIAGLAANKGEDYRYPVNWRLVS